MRIIYGDLDGVFADFNKAALNLFPDEDYRTINKTKFWNKVKTIDNFFYDLDVIPGSLELLDYVLSIPNSYFSILTALPIPTGKLHNVKEQKTEWVKKHLGNSINVETIIGGKNKGKYCSSVHDILFDDMQRNIDVWKENGGIGIFHTSPSDTINQLKNIIS
jgi:hypothetical protein